MARSMARQAAMQLLYERLSGGEAGEESMAMVKEQLAEHNADKAAIGLTKDDKAFIQDILAGVEEKKDQLDEIIRQHSTGEWTLERVANVDLCILRMAIYEILYRDDVPNNVAISQAVELSRLYSEPKSSRYINGVLGAIERKGQEG